MKKKKLDDSIFDFEYLDDEERELIESIEEAIENGELKPVSKARFLKEKAFAERAARNTLAKMAKNARVNVRMNQRDLIGLKAKAAEVGMPYQTLLSCLVHQYVNGKITFSLL